MVSLYMCIYTYNFTYLFIIITCFSIYICDTIYSKGFQTGRLQAADVKFLRTCSFLFMRFRPGAEPLDLTALETFLMCSGDVWMLFS